jgi:hypothetical protein
MNDSTNENDGVPIKVLIHRAIDRLEALYFNPDLDQASRVESPIEHILLRELEKIVHPGAMLIANSWVSTRSHNYRVDFLLEHHGRRVAIEADGRRWHDLKADLRRDLEMVRSRQIQAVYRVNGTTIYHRVHHALGLISLAEPALFSIKGKLNLASLSGSRRHYSDRVLIEREPCVHVVLEREFLHNDEEDEDAETAYQPGFVQVILTGISQSQPSAGSESV